MVKKYWLLVVIIGLSLILRWYNLGYPGEYYFDEVYHAVTAKAYAANDPAGYEWWHAAPEPGTAYEWLHPPLGKLLMASGIAVFGEKPWAWRLPGTIFGVLVIWLTYWLGSRLAKKHEAGLLAALLVSMDGLLLTQSRIGMNDIYVTFFILAAIGAYALSWTPVTSEQRNRNRWLWASGLATGLAVATKWSGVFILLIVGCLELGRWYTMGRKWWLSLPRLVGVYLVLPALIYLLSFSQFWLQGHTIGQFKELHQQIWWYQTNLEATHPYQSQAWEWPLLLKPVWYFVDYLSDGRIVNIYNLGNPALLWMGLVGVAGLVESSFRRKKPQRFRYERVWLVAYLGTWLPWLISPRIMFFYHYAPAVPFLGLSLVAWCTEYISPRHRKKLTGLMLLGVGICFIWFLPIWLGLPLTEMGLKLRLWLPTWK